MKRARYLVLTVAVVLGIAAASLQSVAPRLVWNISTSVPVGLYRVGPTGRLAIGDLVAVTAPQPVSSFMVSRGYIDRDVPILKHVMGLSGQRACRHDRVVTLDGAPLGEARHYDSLGRDLPIWQGCRQIVEDEVFLMNPDVSDSFDGRYFGPFPDTTVIGNAIPIFTDEGGDGRFVWRVPMR